MKRYSMEVGAIHGCYLYSHSLKQTSCFHLFFNKNANTGYFISVSAYKQNYTFFLPKKPKKTKTLKKPPKNQGRDI